jgi:hypothetical protein
MQSDPAPAIAPDAICTKKNLKKFSLGVEGGEHFLEGVFERKVESLSGEISDDVGEISSPESEHTLFPVDTNEAINDSGVSRNFSTSDSGIGILGLDDEFYSLDGGGDGLGDSTTEASKGEINQEVLHSIG